MSALVDRSASRSHDQAANPYEDPTPDEITGSIFGATLPESARISRESARIALESASASSGASPVESAPIRIVSGGGPPMPGICATATVGMTATESITAVRASGTANKAAFKRESLVVARAPTQNAPAL